MWDLHRPKRLCQNVKEMFSEMKTIGGCGRAVAQHGSSLVRTVYNLVRISRLQPLTTAM